MTRKVVVKIPKTNMRIRVEDTQKALKRVDDAILRNQLVKQRQAEQRDMDRRRLAHDLASQPPGLREPSRYEHLNFA
jgi:uncharacterized protein (DUF2336 family)